MRGWVIVSACIVLAIGLFGFVVTYLVKVRTVASEVGCANNLREITLFAAHEAKPKPGRDETRFLHEVPAGTIVLPGVSPDERLSWVVAALPGFDQRRQDPATILAAIDQARPWTAEQNRQAAKARLPVLLCPGAPPEIGSDAPAPTQYLGIAGLGADAATLPLSEPLSPRAGCFRYDAPTPFAIIIAGDGLSQSLLYGERAADLGPWLRGGPSTVRGLDDSPSAKPVVGMAGQFGGCHPVGANWAFADGSVRFMTYQTDPKILFGLATIAGKDSDPFPGE